MNQILAGDFHSDEAVRWAAIKAAGWLESAARLAAPPGLLDGMHVGELRALIGLEPRTAQVTFNKRGPERFRSGERKGEWKWSKEHVSVLVPMADTDKLANEYELATGLCKECDAGQRWCGWGVDTGSRFRSCDRCGATGKAVRR